MRSVVVAVRALVVTRGESWDKGRARSFPSDLRTSLSNTRRSTLPPSENGIVTSFHACGEVLTTTSRIIISFGTEDGLLP